LVVAASTIAADFAAYVGHPDFSKFITFGIAGLLAGAVALLAPAISKKWLSDYRTQLRSATYPTEI
jgi:hypothetical protein